MARLSKLIVIKDFINRIINKVYNEYENDVITRIVNADNGSEISKMLMGVVNGNLGDNSASYDVAILYYDDKNTIHILVFDDTKNERVQGIISSLVGNSSFLIDGTIFIDDLYNKLIELDNYSDEELKLYFKLSS